MIPHESLGKEVYCVNVFNVRRALRLLVDYPCVYYNCRNFERASMQVESIQSHAQDIGLSDKIVFRRVGRRVVAERGENFNPTQVLSHPDAAQTMVSPPLDSDFEDAEHRAAAALDQTQVGNSIGPSIPPQPNLDGMTSYWSSIDVTATTEETNNE